MPTITTDTEQERLERKAKCFDLIFSGECTGMSLFYERFADMQALQKSGGDTAVLRAVGRLAAEEALRATFEDGFDG